MFQRVIGSLGADTNFGGVEDEDNLEDDDIEVENESIEDVENGVVHGSENTEKSEIVKSDMGN